MYLHFQGLNGKIDFKLTEQAHHIGKAIVFKLEQNQLEYSVIRSKTTKHLLLMHKRFRFNLSLAILFFMHHLALEPLKKHQVRGKI